MRPTPRAARAPRQSQRGGGGAALALAMAVLLGSLSLVAWRQARALEVLELADRWEREVDLARAELEELRGRIDRLGSRSWVVQEAKARLGMRMPRASEIVFLVLPPEGGVP